MIAARSRDVIEEARRLLEASSCPASRRLRILDEYVNEGDWLCLMAVAKGEGVSALEFVDEIERIEADLRERFGREIVIVPAKP